MPTSNATNLGAKPDERAWWDEWNTSYRNNDELDETPSELFARTAKIVNGIIETGRGRVLEIGCGAGNFSRLLKPVSYHGLDLSPAAIAIAGQKVGSLASVSSLGPGTYEAADFHEWPLSRQAYDLVVCVDAVAYFYDQQFALKKMAQSLTPTGKLVLTTINPFVYNRIRRTAKSPLKEGTVSHWLSRDELHTLITSAGFVIEESCSIMPRGNRGILRLINSPRINGLLGQRTAARLREWKERAGLGQYRIVVARKEI